MDFGYVLVSLPLLIKFGVKAAWCFTSLESAAVEYPESKEWRG